MKVYNENKTIELTAYDLEKGYLKADKLFIKHHEAVAEVKEQGHYETVAVYENGGKDVAWVVDIPAVEAKEAYDEYEDIQVYVSYTEKELASREIAQLKSKLSETDYQAIKYAEGLIPETDYANIKAQRQAWRDRINILEKV